MPGKSDRTKTRVLDAARRLFNASGTGSVSTHDVAAAAKMSPGNLYYHYRDKAAIIRDLVDDAELYDERAWRLHAGASFAGFLDFFFGAVERDRFFFTEAPALLRKDAALAELWRSRHRKLTKALLETARGWAAAGVMLPFEDDAAAEDFVDGAWILCHYAAAYFESRSRLSGETAHQRARRLMLSYLRPYHTAAGLAALDLVTP
jgi:AcrR family transcriptional regulator